MSDLLNEVKDELAEENFYNILKKISPYLIGGLLIICLCMGAIFWYKEYNLNKVYKAGGEYITAVNKVRAGNLAEGLKKFQTLENHSNNYAALAMFNLAAAANFNKDLNKAIDIYTKIAFNKSYSIELRQLADLMRIHLMLENKIINNADAIEQLKVHLEKDPIYKYTAWELLIALYIEEKNFTKAQEILDTFVSNTSIPLKLRQRVEQYFALIKK